MISVRVPATPANLGPGYDAVGLALTLSMRIGLDRSPHPEIEIRGTGADLIPRGPEHPAYRAARFVAELVGESDAHFRLVQENSIPPTRGLGGSAAALVGGAVAANDLFGGQIAAPDLLNIVCELDGHPDNAAPAMLGALAAGEYELLRVAMQDRLHQPYRSHLVPGLEDVIDAALANGAYGACLSGSGPTVLAFAPESVAQKRIASAMQVAFETRGVEARSWVLDVNLSGARVEPPGEVPAPSLEPIL